MRRHSPFRILITLVLMLWTPWCFCGLRAELTATAAEAAQSASTPCCCCCCERPTVTSNEMGSAGTTDEPCDPGEPCTPGHGCGGGCCDPRLASLVPSFHVPVDTIGVPLGSHTTTIVDWSTDLTPSAGVAAGSTCRWPPGEGGPRSGRTVLLQSSILRT